jgi:hypothetical protein
MRKSKLTLPPIPSRAYSILDPWQVKVTAIPTTEHAAGMCTYTARQISVDSEYTLMGQWQIFAHELFHMIMYEAGIDTGVEEKTQELVCDAFGTWFAGAIKAGYLAINEAKA